MTNILAVITTEFVPYGGLTTVMMNYYRTLDLNVFHVDFASTNDEPEALTGELQLKGSKYFCLGKRKRVLNYCRNLKNVLQGGKYDVIHIHANSATATIELLVATLEKVPKRIIHIHNSTCEHKIIHVCLMPVFNHLYTDAIACSAKAGKWIFKDKFYLLPNAIDVEKYSFCNKKRIQTRRELSISENTIVIGNVGKMESEQKNHRFMIETFSKLCRNSRNYILILIGDGEKRRDYEDLVKEQHIENRVLFLGMRSDVPALLSAMDIFLFPSLWEGLPLSVVEAQCAGLPCLISENITNEVVVTELVKQIDLDAGIDYWIKEIKKVDLNDREKKSHMAKENLSSSGFNIESNLALIEKIYLK